MDFFNLFNKTQFRADQVATQISGSGGADCWDTAVGSLTTPLNNSINGQGACQGYQQFTLAWHNGNAASGGPGNFGLASGDRGPRQIQYGLKVEF
jgi:hypothetical protein